MIPTTKDGLESGIEQHLHTFKVIKRRVVRFDAINLLSVAHEHLSAADRLAGMLAKLTGQTEEILWEKRWR